MTTYVLRYANYLEELEISDFATDEEAEAFVKEKGEEDPQWTTTILTGPAKARELGMKLRHDIYDIIMPEGQEVLPDIVISGDDLWERIETWMKEGEPDAPA